MGLSPPVAPSRVRTLAALALLAVFSPLASSVPSSPAPALEAAGAACALAPATLAGCPLWSATLDGPAHQADWTVVARPSADGNLTYVAGASPAPSAGRVLVLAIAQNGSVAWSARFGVPAASGDTPADLVVAPDGARVYLLAQVRAVGGDDALTVALDGATGAEVWRASHSLADFDGPVALAVSPDGARLYATGTLRPAGSFLTDAWAFARDAATGAALWNRTLDEAGRLDSSVGIAASPDGTAVFVGAYSERADGARGHKAARLDAANGSVVWDSWVRTSGGNCDGARDMALDPAGTRLYLVGSHGCFPREDFGIVAFSAASGATAWTAVFDGGAHDTAYAVDAAGGRVLVVGRSQGMTSCPPLDDCPLNPSFDFLTLAYDAARGTLVWSARYGGVANGLDEARDVVGSPDGAAVYVTGNSQGQASGPDAVTIAYDAASGGERWVARHNGAGNSWDFSTRLALGSGGATLYASGSSVGSGGTLDLWLTALRTTGLL